MMMMMMMIYDYIPLTVVHYATTESGLGSWRSFFFIRPQSLYSIQYLECVFCPGKCAEIIYPHFSPLCHHYPRGCSQGKLRPDFPAAQISHRSTEAATQAVSHPGHRLDEFKNHNPLLWDNSHCFSFHLEKRKREKSLWEFVHTLYEKKNLCRTGNNFS